MRLSVRALRRTRPELFVNYISGAFIAPEPRATQKPPPPPQTASLAPGAPASRRPGCDGSAGPEVSGSPTRDLAPEKGGASPAGEGRGRRAGQKNKETEEKILSKRSRTVGGRRRGNLNENPMILVNISKKMGSKVEIDTENSWIEVISTLSSSLSFAGGPGITPGNCPHHCPHLTGRIHGTESNLPQIIRLYSIVRLYQRLLSRLIVNGHVACPSLGLLQTQLLSSLDGLEWGDTFQRRLLQSMETHCECLAKGHCQYLYALSILGLEPQRQGEPGHSPDADWPAPSPPLWDPGAAKRQEASQGREKTPLFLHPNLWR
ncbi:uncharacterized protein LOC123000747 [Ursus arctos]|uniref:uncharacterized protein LOC123000747 n=1 Tax=Ursus arctos TaxID=9644 RepID=UPI002548078F|nr:uncharacterized protein LOC123000747 [Ursus arctos]